MDDVIGRFFTAVVSPETQSEAGLQSGIDTELDPEAALLQEQLFYREFELPNDALSVVNREADRGSIATEGLAASQSSDGVLAGADDSSRLRAFAARNAYLTMSLQAASNEITARTAESRDLRAEVSAAENARLEMDSQLAELRHQHEKVLSELNATRNNVRHLEAGLRSAAGFQDQCSELQKQLAAARQEEVAHQAAMSEVRSKLTGVQSTLVEVEAECTRLRNESAAAASGNGRLRADAEALRRDLAAARETAAHESRAAATASAENASLQSRLAASDAARGRLEEQLAAVDAESRQLRADLAALKSSLQQTQAKSAQLQKPTADPSEVRRLLSRIEAQAENRQRYLQELSAARKRIAELEALNRKLNAPSVG